MEFASYRQSVGPGVEFRLENGVDGVEEAAMDMRILLGLKMMEEWVGGKGWGPALKIPCN